MFANWIGYIYSIMCLGYIYIYLINPKYAIGVIISVLAIIYPFDSLFPRGLSLSVTFIYLYFIMSMFNRKGVSNLLPKLNIYFTLLFITVLYGLIIGLFSLNNSLNLSDIGKISPELQLLFSSIGYFSVPLFAWILYRYRNEMHFSIRLQKLFTISILIQLIAFILVRRDATSSSINYYSDFDSENIGVDIIRFSSLLQDYELFADYAFMVCGISIILYKTSDRFRFVYLLTFFSAIVLALFTGTRSFILIIIGLFFLIAVFNIYKSRKWIVSGLCVFILFIWFLPQILEKLFVDNPTFLRFAETFTQIGQNQKFSNIAHRDFSSAFQDIIFYSNGLGFGNFYLYTFRGNEMISHSFYLAFLARFGVFFTFVLFFGILRLIQLFIEFIKSKHLKRLKGDTYIIFFIIFCLLFQQVKISALRIPNVLLMYVFIFFILDVNLHYLYTNKKPIRNSTTDQL